MKENYGPLQVYTRGLLRSFGLALILIVVMTTVFFFMDLNNNLIRIFEYIILLLSVLYAGVYVSRRSESKGWLHGVIVGSVYFLILLLINIATATADFQVISTLPKWIFFASIGLIGGCIGINLR